MQIKVVPSGLIHWQIDALGGTSMETLRRGALDGAVYAVNASGQIVIPADHFGGKVRHVRGVWLTTVTFNWDGYYAATSPASATNYFASAVNNANETVITLASPPAAGTYLQAYYYFSNSQQLAANDLIEAYPCWFKAYEGPYPIEVASSIFKGSSAPDADQWAGLACLEAYGWTGDDAWCACARAIMNALKTFEAAGSPGALDGFDYSLGDRPIGGLYTFNGASDVVNFFNTVSDPEDATNRILKVQTTVTANGYAAWGRLKTFDMTNAKNFFFTFKGTGSFGKYLIILNNSATLDQGVNYRWYCAFVDEQAVKSPISIKLTQFIKLLNIAYKPVVQDTAWWTAVDGNATMTTTEAFKKWAEGDATHWYARDLSWNLGTTGTYAIAGITVPTGILSTGEANINFYIDVPVAMTVRFKVKDNGNEIYKCDKFLNTGVQRVSIPWASFVKDADYQPPDQDNNGVLNHPIKTIEFAVIKNLTSVPVTGRISVAEIKFGNYYSLPAGKIYDYQIWFPQGVSSTAYFDDMGFDIPQAIDKYAGVPRFSYQWNALGASVSYLADGTYKADGSIKGMGCKVSEIPGNTYSIGPWRGPTYIGYLSPAFYQKKGELSTAQAMVAMMSAAQNEYAVRYSVTPGPFMPVYLRNSEENTDYGTLDTFTWNGPDTNTNWGGFQYRALASLAHYYYSTGSSTAKAVLDNWMTWLSTRIIDDAAYPNAPKGYKPPANYTKDTGNYTYDYFSPDFHALIAQAMIFKYWRDGDSVALTWYRRLLDDLITNRKQANGSYKGDYTYAFHNAEVGKALGMLINGRQGGVVHFPLTAGANDGTALVDLYNYFYYNQGATKPCSTSPDGIPLHTLESVTQQISKVYISDTAATSESIALCLYLAVDHNKYLNNPPDTMTWWMGNLLAFLKQMLGIK